MNSKDEVKSLQSTCEKAQQKLRDTERELAAVQAENQTLRLQVVLHLNTNSFCVSEHGPACVHRFKNITREVAILRP